MTRRAIQKKLAKKFQVGDVVTWGNKRIAHRIVEVQAHGVVVDSTSTKFGQQQPDGRLFTFIPFVPARKYGMDVGPPERTAMKPEVGRRDVHAAQVCESKSAREDNDALWLAASRPQTK